ncbi:MAG: BrnT family toxin [Pseudomonas sp.]
MNIEFDPPKNQRNIAERGLSFEEVANFEFENALFWMDNRKDYGEQRIRALGYVGLRLHSLVFVETITGIRIISFRKANKREVKHYESQA